MKKYIPNFEQFNMIMECKDDANVSNAFDELTSSLMSYLVETEQDPSNIEQRTQIASIMNEFQEGRNLSECLRKLADVVENIK